MNYDWKNAEYPMVGVAEDGSIVCFSDYRVGHVTKTKNEHDVGYWSKTWIMEDFKPYTPPKEKTKLWYWEYAHENSDWEICSTRLSEEKAKEVFQSDKDYRKIEALGYIEEE